MKKQRWVGLGLAVGAIAALVVGCSTATELSQYVNQDRIYQEYRVTFDEEEKRTRVEAQFRFGDSSGTTLELSGDSRVEHDGLALARSQFLGTQYEGSHDGRVSFSRFLFVDNEGRSYENAVSLPHLHRVVVPEHVNQGEALRIRWFPPLDKNETVTVWVAGESTDGSYTGMMETKDREGATELIFTANRLKELNPGKHSVRLERTRRFDLQEETEAGGKIYGTVRAQSASTTLN